MIVFRPWPFCRPRDFSWCRPSASFSKPLFLQAFGWSGCRKNDRHASPCRDPSRRCGRLLAPDGRGRGRHARTFKAPGYFLDGRKASRPSRQTTRMASDDGSGTTGSSASKPGCTKFKADVNTSMLLSVLPNAVKVPLKVAKVSPLPKAYEAVNKLLFAVLWESSSSS